MEQGNECLRMREQGNKGSFGEQGIYEMSLDQSRPGYRGTSTPPGGPLFYSRNPILKYSHVNQIKLMLGRGALLTYHSAFRFFFTKQLSHKIACVKYTYIN